MRLYTFDCKIKTYIGWAQQGQELISICFLIIFFFPKQELLNIFNMISFFDIMFIHFLKKKYVLTLVMRFKIKIWYRSGYVHSSCSGAIFLFMLPATVTIAKANYKFDSK